VKFNPPAIRHVFAGFAGSKSCTGWFVMFRSSTYSLFTFGKSVPAKEVTGPYITSLMTIGPITGPALSAPGVGAVWIRKSLPPVLCTTRPRV